MTKSDVEIVKSTLEDSDIVWSKYGSDTIEALAQRIVDKLNKSKNNEQENS